MITFEDSIPVVFLTPSLYIGGAERWLLSLCNKFDPQRVRVFGIVVECENCVSPVIREILPQRVKIWYGRRGIEQAAAMGCTLMTWGISDLDRLVDGLSIPIVHTNQGGPTCEWNKKRTDSAIRANAHLIAVSRGCIEGFPEEIAKRVTIIENGIDVERVVPRIGRNAMRERLGIGPSHKVVGHVGRLMADKGVDRLVEALALLPSEWRLLLAGPAEHWPDMPLDQWQAKTNNRIITTPPVDHVGDVLAAIDVYSLLSPSEGHPMAWTEAAMAGVPTVVSDLPWIRYLEETYGRLSIRVDRNNAAECARSIENAFNDSTIAQYARRIAWQHLNSSRMAFRYEQYLRKLNGKAD